MRKILLLGAVFGISACGGGSDSATTPATPVATNTAPVLAAANADQTGEVNTQVNYDATQAGTTFTDADGDALSYAVSYDPAASGLTDTAGVISGSPNAAGTITITITASDGNGGSVSDSFELADNLSDRGADQGVAQGQREDLEHVFTVRMRVLPASFRPGGVDRAVVVRAQEWAGCGIKDVVAVAVQVKVFVYEFGGANAEVFGQAVDVNVPENRTGRRAAIGAIQAVYFLEYLLVEIMKPFV